MNPFGQGYVIMQFREVGDLDSKQADAIKNAERRVVQISLFQNQQIYYVAQDGTPVTLRNKDERTKNIVIFGSNIMYNTQDIEITCHDTPVC